MLGGSSVDNETNMAFPLRGNSIEEHFFGQGFATAQEGYGKWILIVGGHMEGGLNLQGK
ncbi:MAG: hypothetical protein CM1200mP38_1830 [Dehalococcoidia bacterium]|nr:MAG: hypothetical protein CM1200mP38_1830 [Dehalococcoidia bacterium]